MHTSCAWVFFIRKCTWINISTFENYLMSLSVSGCNGKCATFQCGGASFESCNMQIVYFKYFIPSIYLHLHNISNHFHSVGHLHYDNVKCLTSLWSVSLSPWWLKVWILVVIVFFLHEVFNFTIPRWKQNTRKVQEQNKKTRTSITWKTRSTRMPKTYV